MGHAETWHAMVAWMRWDGRGVMDITRGGEVTCQHGIYANNVTGYGRVGHRLLGGGVLPMSWMRWRYFCTGHIHFLWPV
jgi:hypothetical protein